MEEFNRRYTPINWGENDNATIKIVLKFKDDFEDTWERNDNNTLRFGRVKQLLSMRRTCYFQKIKTYENTDNYGISRKNSVHKILIPIEAEKAIEIQCSISQEYINQFDKAYSYFVKKAKEVVYIVAPQKDVEQCECYFSIYSQECKGSGKRFTDFYQKVDALNIPTVDINKEKDRQIWDKYVNALKKLVKQKENIWKIQKASQAYTDNNGNSDRANYVDITISEEDLNKRFESEIENLFSPNELADYAVNKDSAFIEFDTYRILSQDELAQLNAISSEYFFELSPDTPTNTISGELSFKYSDNDSKEEIYNQIQEKLSYDYGFDDLQIAPDGKIDITENDYPHIKKCVENNFQSIAFVEQDNVIALKVNVKNDEHVIDNQMLKQIKNILDSNRLNQAKSYISNDKCQLVIEVSAPVKGDLFTDFGLVQQNKTYRFGNNKNKNSFIDIDGFKIVDGEYQTNDRIKDFKEKLSEIQFKNDDLTIRQLPTRYVFGFLQEKEKQTQILREIKTLTDLQGKTNFNIRESVMTFTPDSDDDYQKQVQRVKCNVPFVELEVKPYKPSFFIRLNTDMKENRKSIITDIQNNIRKENLNVEYDPLKEYSKVFFLYDFNSEEERDTFKDKFREEYNKHKNFLKLSFDNELGHTTYEFVKNDSMEIEREKEINKNISRADFVFLTREQRDTLQKKIEEYGDDAIFTEGIKIGTLIRKDRNKLKFRITEKFDDFLISPSRNLEDLRNGFIKPIFPGELTNIGRMIKAMAKVTTPGEYKKGIGKIDYPANKNLPNFLFDPNYVRISSQDLEEEKKRILSNLNEPLLANQPKQLEAVAKSLIATDLALI